MLPIPYRAKNPPDHFPFVTIGLIVANCVIFLLTMDESQEIRREVVENFALSHDTFSLMRLFTAMFLHAGWLHLLGNMLFLWVFGASVEGRLRPAKFLAVYLIAGITGSLLQDWTWGILHPEGFGLGASGAIMGLAGAYLYIFPYSAICVAWWIFVYIRAMQWQARWVVMLYVGFDVLTALLTKNGDGVGHLAHIGGAGMGFLLVALLRTRRDSEEVSVVQATRAEVKDYSLLDVRELETLLQQPTEDMELVMAYCERAAMEYGSGRIIRCLEYLNYYSRQLIEKADPGRLALVVLHIPPATGGLPLVFYLRLASRLEAITSNDYAARLYRRVYELAPTAPDSETALFRLAQLMERAFQNKAYAQATYAEMLRLFPNGEMALQARRALQQR